MRLIGLFTSILLLIGSTNIANSVKWGFYAHMTINKIAVFTLPAEMIGFYKHHLTYITENAVNPDKRRYAIKEEAPRHYIDLDVYGFSAGVYEADFNGIRAEFELEVDNESPEAE